jgi:parallel beta-helix repeat protein
MFTLAFNIQSVKAEPKTIYVDDDNTVGPWDGTLEHPYQNVTSGVEHAIDGDTVFVRTGTYYENIVIDKPLSLVGEDKLTTIIDANYMARWAILISQTKNANVSGFTVRNGYRDYLYGGIGMYFADHCNVSGNRFFHLFEAICVDSIFIHYDNCVISENYIEDVNCGIGCAGNNNTISKNIVTSVYGGALGGGIKLINGINNTISDNEVTGVSMNCYGAIMIEGEFTDHPEYSNSNIVSGNYIANSLNGIGMSGNTFKNIVIGNTITECHGEYNFGSGINLYLEYPTDAEENIIVGNNITKCDKGIALSGTKNVVYHNYLVGNAINGLDSDSCDNQWDDGYPSGGNYWGDYTGVDVMRGPDQNEIGSDGIGDTPYHINECVVRVDRYPLMKPFRGIHNIGIRALMCPKAVGQGYNLSISIEILNYGINTETFNVTTHANKTMIQTIMNLSLSGRSSTIITFIWNTTGFAKGNYTIWAYASPVLGETDLLDNNCTDGSVLITKVGDLGSRVGSTNTLGVFDGVVTSTDLSLFLQCYKGTAPAQWMYLADLGSRVGGMNVFFACDGVVTSTDLQLFLLCYKGQGPDP